MITGTQLHDFLIEYIGCLPTFADENYSLPDKEWMFSVFTPALRETFAKLGFTYEKEKQDCDDFARFASAYAGLLHAKMDNATGIAIGEFWFTQSHGGGHAINIYVFREGDDLKFGFFEPQTGQRLHLTQKEIASCEYCRF